MRLWDGQDLLYFTNQLSWRCGLSQITYSVNDGAPMVLETEPCHQDEGAPNALKMVDIMPYVAFAPDSIETITVSITYDDQSTDSATYSRAAVQIN